MVSKAWADGVRIAFLFIAAVVISYKMRQQHMKERAAAHEARERGG